MKKFLVVVLILFMCGCNSKKTEPDNLTLNYDDKTEMLHEYGLITPRLSGDYDFRFMPECSRNGSIVYIKITDPAYVAGNITDAPAIMIWPDDEYGTAKEAASELCGEISGTYVDHYFELADRIFLKVDEGRESTLFYESGNGLICFVFRGEVSLDDPAVQKIIGETRILNE